MDTQQHTPGPWLRSKSGKTFQIVAGSDGNSDPNELVATVNPIGYNCEYEPCDETKANARLISSAPDLLDALDWALRQIEDDLDPDHQAAFDAACSTLAKAKGVIE